MSSAPGVSLFQGGESIQINRSIDLAEEEEELEDRRRRDEELGNLLQNAFDDLDEDETTIDSTTNFQSDLNQGQLTQQDQQKCTEQISHDAFEMKLHQLQMLLDSRTRELGTIKQIASDESKRAEDLQKRLSITAAEMDRALAGKKNMHELLVESKEKCSNFENTISKMRQEKKSLEAENNTLLGKLETAQTLLADVQRKYDMVERDFSKQNERNAEVRRKQMEERHRAEIEMLHQQLEQLANKLDRKTGELESMNSRYQALQSSHELMLVEKASRVNDLNNALGESQRQCEELLGRPDYYQDNIRLQKLVATLEEQRQAMERTIASLQERLESTTAELDLMDRMLRQHNTDGEMSRRLSDMCGVGSSTPLSAGESIPHMKEELYRALANLKSKREGVRRLQQSLEEKDAEIRKLRDEENRALVQITMQQDDKIRLENRLRVLEEEYNTTKASNQQLHLLREEVQQLKAAKVALEQQHAKLEKECNQQVDECKRLNDVIKNSNVDWEELRQEHESLKRSHEQIMKENQSMRSQTCADSVRLELERHKFLLQDAQTECDRLKNLYVEISSAKESLAFEVDQLRNADNIKELQTEREKAANLQRALQLAEVKSSELAKILETEKLYHERDLKSLRERVEKETSRLAPKSATNGCNRCIDYIADITKFEIQNLKLSTVNSTHKQEIDGLSAKLASSKTLVAELTEKLALSNQQETLIKELKTKAQQFEEYIKSHSSNLSSSCSDAATSPHRQYTPSKETSGATKAEIKQIETRIRDEMAKIFAIELKRCQLRMQQAEEQCHALQQEYQRVCADFEQSMAEVELLKHVVLVERERAAELLHLKEGECQSSTEKHNELLRKCRDELHAKSTKINDLAREMEERQLQIEAERQSMKAVMSQWEKQRKHVDHIERDWNGKLDVLQRSHDSAIASWQKKYNSAKRTIENYKRYAEDHEAHMRKEYARLKTEYHTALTQAELRMKELLEQRHNKVSTSTKRGQHDD